jgi:sulfite reductase (NADPH) hemoprotein beta-component
MAKLSNEELKEGSPALAGTIAPALADAGLDHFTEEDYQFLKFHGIYQQDDRDLRKTAKKWIFMIRIRIPGGVLQPEQYLALDQVADRYGNHTLRTTSRQAMQIHGTIKSNLAQTIKAANESLLTTLAACGDVTRNVMAPPLPSRNPVALQIYEHAQKLSSLLLPTTPIYHEIWVEGSPLELNSPQDQPFVDPLYGKTYLPRKFKIAFAIPPHNDVDLFSNCLGFIAIVENGQLSGYNLTAGGGMGRSHGNEDTFPRLADVIGFLIPSQVEAAARSVVEIHRDFGDRTNRRHARLKYVIADRGVDWFRAELERRMGFTLQPARPFHFTTQGDSFGWNAQDDGRWMLCLFIETGRIKDTDKRQLKTALRQIVEQFKPEVRLTPANNLILANLSADQKALVTQVLSGHGVAVDHQGSPVRRSSMACVALPTCGLALAEAERFLPDLITRIEEWLARAGLPDEDVVVRMTGCPNGCARPYMAELGFVGRSPGRYQVYLGGNLPGTRLARLYLDNVKDADLGTALQPLFLRFAQERSPGERFGDWCHRALPFPAPA